MAEIPTAHDSATLSMTALVELKLRPGEKLPEQMPIKLGFERVGGNRIDLNEATFRYAIAEGWLTEDSEGELLLSGEGFKQG